MGIFVRAFVCISVLLSEEKELATARDGTKRCLFGCWFFLAVVRGSWAEECIRVEGEPACVCHMSAGIVDLRPLANTDGTPM